MENEVNWFEKKTLKQKVEIKTKEAWNWLKDNKEATLGIVVIAAGAIKSISKAVRKHIDYKETEELVDKRVYDRSLGHYWELRRKLTNREWVEINERKKDGDSLGDILQQMNLLR